MRRASRLAPEGIQCLNDGTECIGASLSADPPGANPARRRRAWFCPGHPERSRAMSSTLSPTLPRITSAADQQLFVISTHKVRDKGGKPPFAWVPYGVE